MKLKIKLLFFLISLIGYANGQNLVFSLGETNPQDGITYSYHLSTNTGQYYIKTYSIKLVSSINVSAQAVNPSAGVGYVKYLNNPPQGVSGSIILEAILYQLCI